MSDYLLQPAALPTWGQRTALRLLQLAGWRMRYKPLPGPHGVAPSFFKTSSPLMSFPKAVYFPSSCGAGPRQMKNWELAESGFAERAMEMTPNSCL